MEKSLCEICEKVFKTRANLKNHYNHSHNNNGKTYCCNVCTKSFQTQNKLGVHIKAVHGGSKSANVIHVVNHFLKLRL